MRLKSYYLQLPTKERVTIDDGTLFNLTEFHYKSIDRNNYRGASRVIDAKILDIFAKKNILCLSAILTSSCLNWSFKKQIEIYDTPVDSKFPSNKR